MAKKRLPFTRARFCALTTAQWQAIKEVVDNGRKRKYNLLAVVNAILRITRTGLQWRNLEGDYCGVLLLPPMAGGWHLVTHVSGLSDK